MRRNLLSVIFSLGLSVFGFFIWRVDGQSPPEADKIQAINRAHDAGDAFTSAWNDWARQHDRFKTSVEDRARFKQVRKLWKEFDRLCREIEY